MTNNVKGQAKKVSVLDNRYAALPLERLVEEPPSKVIGTPLPCNPDLYVNSPRKNFPFNITDKDGTQVALDAYVRGPLQHRRLKQSYQYYASPEGGHMTIFKYDNILYQISRSMVDRISPDTVLHRLLLLVPLKNGEWHVIIYSDPASNKIGKLFPSMHKVTFLSKIEGLPNVFEDRCALVCSGTISWPQATQLMQSGYFLWSTMDSMVFTLIQSKSFYEQSNWVKGKPFHECIAWAGRSNSIHELIHRLRMFELSYGTRERDFKAVAQLLGSWYPSQPCTQMQVEQNRRMQFG